MFIEGGVELRPQGIYTDVSPIPGAATRTHGKRLFLNEEGHLICVAHLGNEDGSEVASASPIPLDGWVHVGCTQKDRWLRVYVGGELRGERELGGDFQPSLAPVSIGGVADRAAGDTFGGGLSDMRLHEIARSDAFFRAVAAP